jgi:hypothetical protein
VQFFLYLAITLSVLVALIWPDGRERSDVGMTSVLEHPIQILPSGGIRIRENSAFFKRLSVVTVEERSIATPLLTVTGTVVASLRKGRGGMHDWHFHSQELLSVYTNWRKSLADMAYTQSQRASIQALVETRIEAQEALVRRLEQLVATGTETDKDLASARAELLQARIQGRKDTHEADTAWRVSQQTSAALSQQLQQAGLDPDLLLATTEEGDIVVADVPEALVSQVRLGQGCEARFSALDVGSFPGTVRAISPVLSKERRSLRVLFTIRDPNDRLRPGMFAEIGLGTDTRQATLAPFAGVVHVGQIDYLLFRDATGEFHPRKIHVGEPREGWIEILEGAKAGDWVVGQGAILLKPFLMESLGKLGGQVGRGG